MKKKVATIATVAILSTTISTTAFADAYTVQRGDTLTRIANKHNTTVSNLKLLNQLTSDRIYANQTITVPGSAAVVSTQTAPTPAPTAKYTVVSGDTLIKIANRHGITLAELKSWNNIEGHLIYPGQVFNVSGPSNTGSQPTAQPTASSTPISTVNTNNSEYVIRSGDTLSGIAGQHGLSVQQLKTLNNLSSDLIFPGQKLRLSGQSTVSQTVSTGNVATAVEQAAPSPTIATVINEAKSLAGVPYVWGGSTPAGFDCSGFIYYVFNKAGQSMKRLSAEGYYDRSYYVNTPQVGDLVFFENTYKQGISHLGVYLGNNEFIHAGSDGVQITSLNNSYWKQHFSSYKRFY